MELTTKINKKSELQLLKEANDILRSVNSIIERRGETTNWEGIDKKVKMALAEQHELLLAKNCYIPLVIKSLIEPDEIRMKARELDEKDFAQWMYEIQKGNVL